MVAHLSVGLYSSFVLGGLEGHVSRDCTMETKAKSCYKCGEEGHLVRFSRSFLLSRRAKLVLSSLGNVLAMRPQKVVLLVDSLAELARSAIAAERRDI